MVRPRCRCGAGAGARASRWDVFAVPVLSGNAAFLARRTDARRYSGWRPCQRRSWRMERRGQRTAIGGDREKKRSWFVVAREKKRKEKPTRGGNGRVGKERRRGVGLRYDVAPCTCGLFIIASLSLSLDFLLHQLILFSTPEYRIYYWPASSNSTRIIQG